MPHNRVSLTGSDPLELHQQGKATLVFSEHNSAVGLSQERGNCCPNYWHFSPYGFCPYGCAYCYLAGSRGVYFSPSVKIFLNLAEMLGQIQRVACRLTCPTAFYLGFFSRIRGSKPVKTGSAGFPRPPPGASFPSRIGAET